MKILNFSTLIIISLFVVSCRPSVVKSLKGIGRVFRNTDEAVDGIRNFRNTDNVVRNFRNTDDFLKKSITDTEINNLTINALQALKNDPEISNFKLEDEVYSDLETIVKDKGFQLDDKKRRSLRTLSRKIREGVTNNEEDEESDLKTTTIIESFPDLKRYISPKDLTEVSKRAAQRLRDDPELAKRLRDHPDLAKFHLDNMISANLETIIKEKVLELIRERRNSLKTLSRKIREGIINNEEDEESDLKTTTIIESFPDLKRYISPEDLTEVSKRAAQRLRDNPELAKRLRDHPDLANFHLDNMISANLETIIKEKVLELIRERRNSLKTLSRKIREGVTNNCSSQQ